MTGIRRKLEKQAGGCRSYMQVKHMNASDSNAYRRMIKEQPDIQDQAVSKGSAERTEESLDIAADEIAYEKIAVPADAEVRIDHSQPTRRLTSIEKLPAVRISESLIHTDITDS